MLLSAWSRRCSQEVLNLHLITNLLGLKMVEATIIYYSHLNLLLKLFF